MKINLKYAAALAAATTTAGAASAGIVAFAGDSTLAGGQGAFDAASGFGGSMSAIVDGVSPIFSFVSSISTPNGPFGMSPAHDRRVIGSGWGTWSHGYGGEIFYTGGSLSGTYTMPTGTGAWDAYIEPNPFSLQTFVVTGTGDAGGTATTTITAHGSSGASHVGFWSTGGESLVSVTVSGTSDYAIGEFRYAKVPAPGALALLGAAGLVSRRRRR